MAEPIEIADALDSLMTRKKDLAGKSILVSAGPTHEAIDPVRFLGNRSSGKMGYAIASQARKRGAQVILVSGPVSLATPPGVTRMDVRTALEMQAAITKYERDVDAIVMAAAVADFRPEHVAEHKLKKLDGEDARTLVLVRNPDILQGLGLARAERGDSRPMLVGFAVESEHLEAAAKKKLESKRVDLIVANHAASPSKATTTKPFWSIQNGPSPRARCRKSRSPIESWIASATGWGSALETEKVTKSGPEAVSLNECRSAPHPRKR